VIILGWLLLIPLAGGLFLVGFITNESATHGGAWRLLGAAANAAIGGVFSFIGNFLAYEGFETSSEYITFPIAGWIYIIGGILMGTLGFISALTKSKAGVEMDQRAERLKSRLPYDSDPFRPVTNHDNSVSKICANCGASNTETRVSYGTGGRTVSVFCTKCGSALPDIERQVEERSAMDWFNLAFDYQAAGRVQDVERALLCCIDADPTDGLGHEQLGTAYFVAVLTYFLGRLPNIVGGLFWFKVEEVGHTLEQCSNLASRQIQFSLALVEDEYKRVQNALSLAEDEYESFEFKRTSALLEEKRLKFQGYLGVLDNLSIETVERYESEVPNGSN